MNILNFTFSRKDETDCIDYFWNSLDYLDVSPKHNMGRLRASLLALRFHDRRRMPRWGRRLLESFRLILFQDLQLSMSLRLSDVLDISSVRDCLQTSFLIVKKNSDVIDDVACDAGKYLALYRDYAILPVEAIASAYLKNLILQHRKKELPTRSVEVFPGNRLDACSCGRQDIISLGASLNDNELTFLIQSADEFLARGDLSAEAARTSTSITKFLVAARASQFWYQLSLTVLKHVRDQCEAKGAEVPNDVHREIGVAEENRAEIALLLKNDCRDLLLGPIVAPWGQACQVLYSTGNNEGDNWGWVDIRRSLKNGICRNPVYPSVLIDQWMGVLDDLDIRVPFNFVGASRSSAEKLYTSLFYGIAKRFVRSFDDQHVALEILSQMHRWRSAPVDLRELIFEHEAEHVHQAQAAKRVK